MAVVHLSPELPRVTVRGHKREPSDPPDIFSASYPSPAVTAPDPDDGPGQLQRSYSGRPRSQSTTFDIVAKQRKSLRGLGRSGWIITKSKQTGDAGGGYKRSSSASDAESATTEQIDIAFTKIREQLVSGLSIFLY